MTEQRYCKFCESPLERRRNPGGTLEQSNQYRRRMYCNRECKSAEYRHIHETKGVPSEQMDHVPFPQMARMAWVQRVES